MTKESTKRFFEHWQNYNWKQIDNLLDERIEIELIWLDTTIKGKNRCLNLLKKIENENLYPMIKIVEIIGSQKDILVQANYLESKSIINAPHFHSFNGQEYKECKACFLLSWENGKMIGLDIFECPVFTTDEILNWIEKI